ncbi:MAG: sulfate ABC transporter substrate-binding protein [Alkalinema sp. CAN_BIN05]|nr:sulfate ABC transporter substrate-binding protein [Alkalinema sp. CAN_BIN05]
MVLLGLVVSSGVVACGRGNTGNSGSQAGAGNPSEVSLTLVSFAVTKAAYQGILPKFAAKWEKETGQKVKFNQSYGGSGSQARAVIDGLEADVVHLALGLDTGKIQKEGLIDAGWEKKFPNSSVVSKSVAAIVTREGNPKDIKDFSDLSKDGVSWITADPKTSGIARWNYLALWNAAVKSGADDKKAQELITKAYKNVPILTKDAREATDVFFKQGQGDALINYENEVLFAQQKGEKGTMIIPGVNISIDNPVAIVDKVVNKKGTRKVAEAFVQYLFSPEAQAEFAKVGFRPVAPTIANAPENTSKFPKIQNLATVKDFNGWSAVQSKFFADGAMFDQIQAQRR